MYVFFEKQTEKHNSGIYYNHIVYIYYLYTIKKNTAGRMVGQVGKLVYHVCMVRIKNTENKITFF